MIERIPEATHLLYSDLLQSLMQCALPKRGINFHTKSVSGNDYWYMDYVVGSEKRSFYLAPDDGPTRVRVAKAKDLWAREAPDAAQRARLVAMLVAGGATPIPGRQARVLEALSQAGVFLVGGVVVGSHAFGLLANLLGVRWPRAALRTQDIDIAHDYEIHVSVPQVDVDLERALREAEKGFFPVPSLDPKAPSTSFKVRGVDLSVSLLTPMRGRPSSEPRRIPALNAMAEPVRFLEYLLEDVQPAAVPVRQGVLVNVPSPGRFALHKLVVSERRPAAFAEKARKDGVQAGMVLEVLMEDLPGELLKSWDAAMQMPSKFQSQLERGLGRLDEVLERSIRHLLGA